MHGVEQRAGEARAQRGPAELGGSEREPRIGRRVAAVGDKPIKPAAVDKDPEPQQGADRLPAGGSA